MRSWARVGGTCLVAGAAFAVALALDDRAYVALAKGSVYDRDWGRLLRVLGYAPTWLVAALALGLHDRRAGRGARRAATLALAPVIGGALAEGLKLLLRRERPGDVLGPYVYRAFDDRPWSTSGLGLPSSHALVAFGAAVALARLFPAARWVWYGLAAGCAWSRVAAHAHWLSDVVAAAGVAAITATIAWGSAAADPDGSDAASPGPLTADRARG